MFCRRAKPTCERTRHTATLFAMESEHFVGKVALRGIVERDGKILVARDVKDDIWEWPGGRLHMGEHPEEALRREFFEELGIEIEVGDIFYTEQWKHVRSGIPQVFLFYRCTIAPNATAVADKKEVAEVKWITNEELKDLPMWEDCRRAADELLKILSGLPTQK